MKYKILVPLMVLSLNAGADQQTLDLPSCDVKGQREALGETGGKISDTRQAHISVRANVLGADIATARKAHKITEVEAGRMNKRVEDIRLQTDRFVEQQGFLSAAESASFDREYDAITRRLCR